VAEEAAVEEPLAEDAAVVVAASAEAVVAAEAASESHLVGVEVAEGAAVAVEDLDAEELVAVGPKLSSSRTDTVAFSLPRERNTF